VPAQAKIATCYWVPCQQRVAQHVDCGIAVHEGDVFACQGLARILICTDAPKYADDDAQKSGDFLPDWKSGRKAPTDHQV